MSYNLKRNILGVYVDVVDYEMVVERTMDAAKNRYSLAISPVAVNNVMGGMLDLKHRYRLNQMDLVTPDGQPVRWALNLLYRARLSDRVYAPTLMLRVCAAAEANQISVFLYGNHQTILDDLERNLCRCFPKLIIAGKQASRFRTISEEEKQADIEQIVGSGAGVVFVGLGASRQEVWIHENKKYLPIPLIGVGAAFNFHSGHVRQAPVVLQNLGLEWLFRLTQEPKRLWKRYLLLNPLYLFMLLLQITKLRYFSPEDAIVPTEDMNFG